MALSLRRNVEGWMGDLLYEKLGDEPRSEVAWKLLRDLVGQQLFGSEFAAIPFIEAAAYFNQLFVFVKKQNVLSALGFRPPSFKIVGNLDYLVNRELSTWSPQLNNSPWDVADSHRMYREYRLRINSNQEGPQKSIDFQVLEAHARSIQPPVPGSVTIHRNLLSELSSVRKLYVITDVVLASYIKIVVQIGDQSKTFVYEQDTPIAFRYRKYKLAEDGAFILELNTTLKIWDREAIWLRPALQPIPVPQWNCGLFQPRVTKHNLTIPPPINESDLRVLRSHSEHGVARVERSHLNRVILRAINELQEARLEEHQYDDQWITRYLLGHIRPLRRSVSIEVLTGSD